MDAASHAEIFQRQQALLGDKAMEALAQAHVAVCGLGGVGSYLVEALARSGIGALTLVDFDRVAVSNLNRQLCALQSTVGQEKAEVVAARIQDINPYCRLQLKKSFFTDDNAAQILGKVDYIADAIDHIPGKVGLIAYAKEQEIPIISAMGAARRVDPARLRIADISETHVCPLARMLRKELRWREIERGVTVVFSEEPAKAQEKISASGEEAQFLGSVAFVPSVMGLLMASVIVRDLAGVER